jgi:putative FmdB family regulatory protein
MPIYEYHCRTCHKQVSLWFRSVAQANPKTATCTECGGRDLVRLITRVATTPNLAGMPVRRSKLACKTSQELAAAIRGKPLNG